MGAELTCKRGDTARALSDTLEINGLPADLTDATVYAVFRRDTGAVLFRKPAQIVDALNGQVRVQLDADIVGTVRRWKWEWEAENDYHLLTVMADLG